MLRKLLAIAGVAVALSASAPALADTPTVASVGVNTGAEPQNVDIRDRSGQWIVTGALNSSSHSYAGAASGSAGALQFDDGGFLAGASGLSWNAGTGTFTLPDGASWGASGLSSLTIAGLAGGPANSCLELNSLGRVAATGDPCGSGSSGAVSSVALSAPAIFTVGGSPVTSTGTLGLTLATEAAHTFWRGPTSGSAATPVFAAIVTSDLPTGASVADPGTGTLEALLPVQSVTGASYNFGCADAFLKTRRSNAGAAMSDTLQSPGSGCLANGAQLHVANVDPSAALTLNAYSGTSIEGLASFTLPPAVGGVGREVSLAYDATNDAWRFVDNTGDLVTPASAPKPFPYVQTLQQPLQPAQIYGPAGKADALGLASRVNFAWAETSWTVPGMLNGYDVAGYRIGPNLATPAGYSSMFAWMQAVHPDWIAYTNDEATPAYYSGPTFAISGIDTSGVMTVTSVVPYTGSLAAAQVVTGTATALGTPLLQNQTLITSQLSGTTGGAGTYQVAPSPTIAIGAQATMNAANPYPPFDFTNPAAMAWVVGQWNGQLSGYNFFSVDNIVDYNSYGAYGHYTGTQLPCGVGQTYTPPACGGTFVTLFPCNTWPTPGCSTSDPTYFNATLAWLDYINANAIAPTLCNITVGLSGTGAEFVALASACGAVMTESVPLAYALPSAPTSADKWISGAIIDDLAMEDLYKAESISTRPYLHNAYFETGDTGTPPSGDDEMAALGWSLLVDQNAAQNWFYAGAPGSTLPPAYLPSEGGLVSDTFTASLTANSASVTVSGIVGNATALLAGLKVSGACIPDGDYIKTVSSSTAITLAQAVANTSACTGTGQLLKASGMAPLPIGAPASAPPAVNPYASPPTGVCGWINGASLGVCSRQYLRGGVPQAWVYWNPVCQIVSGSCSLASQTLTIPSPPSGDAWYAEAAFGSGGDAVAQCGTVAAGAFDDGSGGLAAGNFLVIAAGPSAGPCPWGSP